MRIDRIATVVGIVLCLGAMSSIAHAQKATVRIGGWSLRANGQVAQGFEYTGSCPVQLKFGWSLLGTAPTTSSYIFVRSDGGHSGAQTISVPVPNRAVFIYDSWQLGANTPQFADFQGWVQLDVTTPNPVHQRVPVTLHCK
jgi:hypothetical protein